MHVSSKYACLSVWAHLVPVGVPRFYIHWICLNWKIGPGSTGATPSPVFQLLFDFRMMNVNLYLLPMLSRFTVM